MTLKQVMSELKAMGSAQTRKIYGRHGVEGEMFGVSYANLGNLKKKVGRDTELARGLWASGNHDARIFACMIADPSEMKAGELDAMCRDLDNYVVCDAFAGLAAKSPSAETRLKKWCGARREWVSAAGWNLVAHAAGGQPEVGEAFLMERLEVIERTIHTSQNRVRHSMNQALISIGIRGAKLRKAAEAAAKRIGKVEVDHGETSCTTPDAVAYIAKTLAHRKARKK